MSGELYVISECIHPETQEAFWKRTEAVDGLTAVRLCARLNERCIYSRIVPICARYKRLPVAIAWRQYAADWFAEPAVRLARRCFFNFAGLS